jgi:integrase
VLTFTGGKEKWTSLKTELLSVARIRMKEHVEAAEREGGGGAIAAAGGKLSFGGALAIYRERLAEVVVRPNTRACREAGIKLVLKTWDGIEEQNVRRITPEAVYRALAAQLFKAARRRRAEKGPAHIPTREEFTRLIAGVRAAGVSDCRASADFLSFIAFSGARKSEAANATWADVDFDRGNIRLRMTKSGEGRTVPIFPEMRELLTRMKRERENVGPSDPVLLVREAQGFINSTCKRLGIPQFTHHALRAMFGTTCLEVGSDVRAVAQDVLARQAGARAGDGGEGELRDDSVTFRHYARRDVTDARCGGRGRLSAPRVKREHEIGPDLSEWRLST